MLFLIKQIRQMRPNWTLESASFSLNQFVCIFDLFILNLWSSLIVKDLQGTCLYKMTFMILVIFCPLIEQAIIEEYEASLQFDDACLNAIIEGFDDPNRLVCPVCNR